MLELPEFREHLNAALDEVLAAHTRAATEFDPLYGELLEHLRQFLARGGKRLRPYLMYLSFCGSGAPDKASAGLIRASVSQELYHNAWLIHDDLIDRDLVRYGAPNIAGRYRTKFAQARVAGGRHLADSLALIAGDINATLATGLILEAPFPTEARLAAVAANTRANFEVFAGETLDVLVPTLEAAEVTTMRLLKLYQAKTAAYSIRAPLEVGALLAGRPAGRLAAIADFATPLGIAFQITDDLLGTFGHEQELGKSVLSDLREGKRTILHMTALRLATPAARKRLEASSGNPKAGYHDLAEIRTIYEACGARSTTEKLADEYANQALAALPGLGYSEPVARELDRLVRYLTHRTS